jgi:hypothetical protein
VGAATPEKSSDGDLVGDYESRELRKTYSVAWSPGELTIVADGFPSQQLRSVADDRMRFADVDIEIQFHRDQDQKPTRFSLSSNTGRVQESKVPRAPVRFSGVSACGPTEKSSRLKSMSAI